MLLWIMGGWMAVLLVFGAIEAIGDHRDKRSAREERQYTLAMALQEQQLEHQKREASWKSILEAMIK